MLRVHQEKFSALLRFEMVRALSQPGQLKVRKLDCLVSVRCAAFMKQTDAPVGQRGQR